MLTLSIIIFNSKKKLTLIHFFNGNYEAVPEALELRSKTFTLIMMGILAASFLLVAISRMRNNKAIPTVISVFFKNASLEQSLKDNMRLESMSSILLIINYFVSFSLCLFIFFNRIVLLDGYWAALSSIIIPIALFFLETVGLFMVGILTGELKKLSNAIVVTLTGNQLVGLGLSLLSLLWIMNPAFNKICFGAFVSIICFKYLTRLVKNSITVLLNGVPWYYIILYFCTLEILPLFVAYYYVLKNFLI